MEYVLTQEEMDNLIPKWKLDEREEALLWAKKAILRTANFECIHENTYSYCDECPISNVGDAQTDKASYEISRHVCGESRKYSK